MNKSTIVAIIVVALIIAGGIVEVKVFENKYSVLEEKIHYYAERCLDESLTANMCVELAGEWRKLREQSEIFYANIDLYELNIRITDACAFVRCGDFKQAYNQLKIAEMLCVYVPELIKPNLQHII